MLGLAERRYQDYIAPISPEDTRAHHGHGARIRAVLTGAAFPRYSWVTGAPCRSASDYMRDFSTCSALALQQQAKKRAENRITQ